MENDQVSRQHGDAETEYTISDLYRKFDIDFRALRFYEENGLLHPRRRGTARFYGDKDIKRLELILRGERLGLTLPQILDYVAADNKGVVSGESQIDDIVRQAVETFGSEEKAARWLRRPTEALSGASPLDVVSSGNTGLRKVTDLLERINHGLSV